MSDTRVDRDLLLNGMNNKFFGLIVILSFVFMGFTAHADDPAPVDPNPPVDPIPVVDPTPVPDQTLIPADTIPPTINLLGSATVNMVIGQTYVDAGATATDDVDGDITVNIVVGNLVDTSKIGSYIVTYNIKDAALNSAVEVKRIVNINLEKDLEIENGCSVDDTNNEHHVFLKENTSLAVCALVAAKNAGYIDSFRLSNSIYGLSVDEINGIAPNSTQYWALWKNSDYADCGIECLSISGKDTLSLVLTDWMSNTEVLSIKFYITKLTLLPKEEKNIAENSGGGGSPVVPIFSISNANNFLASHQNANGSFGDVLYTDWVAIAAVASNASFISSLKNYLQNNNFESSVATDNERHAMALSALGINPYSGTSINYIKKITDSFDGTQIGDSSLINDDIFGLIVLGKSGYTKNDDIISRDISYVISKQSSDGSFSGSVDMTAAAIQALRMYSGNGDAISRAENYLVANQNQSDGGYGNNFSTSWVLQSISSNGSLSSNATRATNYLAGKQHVDGGTEDINSDIQNRIWSTSYAIPAVLNKSWSDILQDFDKPVVVAPSQSKKTVDDAKIIEIKKPEIVLTSEIIKEEPVLASTEVVKIIKPATARLVANKKILATEVKKESIQKRDVVKSDNLTASAANSAVSDKIPRIAKAIWGGIASVFRSIFSYF